MQLLAALHINEMSSWRAGDRQGMNVIQVLLGHLMGAGCCYHVLHNLHQLCKSTDLALNARAAVNMPRSGAQAACT